MFGFFQLHVVKFYNTKNFVANLLYSLITSSVSKQLKAWYYALLKQQLEYHLKYFLRYDNNNPSEPQKEFYMATN